MPSGGSKPGDRRGRAGGKTAELNSKAKMAVALRDAANRVVADEGITPLEFMLSVMRAPIPKNASPAAKVAMASLRLEAAKAAAPYVHAKIGTLEVDPSKNIDAAAKLREAARAIDMYTDPPAGANGATVQ